jgi:hypothetical protein
LPFRQCSIPTQLLGSLGQEFEPSRDLKHFGSDFRRINSFRFGTYLLGRAPELCTQQNHRHRASPLAADDLGALSSSIKEPPHAKMHFIDHGDEYGFDRVSKTERHVEIVSALESAFADLRKLIIWHSRQALVT